jgi:hypothetical protein
MNDKAANLHIYFVLDRSGSMDSIRSDVIGGFNVFLRSQQAEGPDALMTLVQFDSQDPHEILLESKSILDVEPLSSTNFVPRSGTPLYDAMGHVIADATSRAERRRGSGEPREEILFVTFSDGEENASVEYSRAKVFDLIKRREAEGWSFAYLGANQDAYAEGGHIGYSAGSIQNFAADSAGSAAAFASLSGAVSRRRQKMRTGEAYDRLDLFEDEKEAEVDLGKRQQQS